MVRRGKRRSRMGLWPGWILVAVLVEVKGRGREREESKPEEGQGGAF